MSKHHLQSAAEQISKTGHGSAPFHQEKMPNQAREVLKSEDVVVTDSSLQLTAYQIHQEKGGTALDNWLEAERKLKNAEIKELSKVG